MIKDPAEYNKLSREEKIKYLRSLSIEDGVKILEAILCSRLQQELHFRDDDNPLSLARSLEKCRNRH